jgi:hypothetical protein
MMSGDVVVGVANDTSNSMPSARDQEIQGFQQLIRLARNLCRLDSHSKFAIRSILVRRTKIERDVDYLGAVMHGLTTHLGGCNEATSGVTRLNYAASTKR